LTVVAMPFRFLLTVALGLALTACGGSSVGSAGLFNYTPKPPGNFAFQSSPSPNARAAIGSQGAPPTSAPKQTQAPPPAAKFNIAIYGDTSSTPGFYPPDANIIQGTIVVFTNKDSQPRSVATDPGDPASFSSPMIAPGGTWQWTAGTLGTYNYHDGTRPYAIASFKVVPR
jgi:hypothetical protein